jgi:hypothetical protein
LGFFFLHYSQNSVSAVTFKREQIILFLMKTPTARIESRDPGLEALMLEEYPGALFPDRQHEKIGPREERVYHFTGLDMQTTVDFLRTYKGVYQYSIYNEKTGQMVFDSMPNIPQPDKKVH